MNAWASDIAAAIGIIALCVFAFVALDVAAEVYQPTIEGTP